MKNKKSQPIKLFLKINLKKKSEINKNEILNVLKKLLDLFF